MSRIVAGTHGGRHLDVPPGRGVRPTSDRVREALFATLESMVGLAGCRFADLYAGSAAVGLEAASRGAAAVLLVESDPRAARTARANIEALDVGDTCRLVVTAVTTLLATRPAEPFDVVFADPPYRLSDTDLAKTLELVLRQGWLGEDAVLVVERSSRSPQPSWPAGMGPASARRYGQTTLWYVRPAARGEKAEKGVP